MSNLAVKSAVSEVRRYVLEGLVAEAEMACGDDTALLRAMEADAKLLFAIRNAAIAVAESGGWPDGSTP